MKLIVGLGNPGRKYEGTRHNIGFDVLSEIARKNNAEPPRAKFDALAAEVRLGSDKTLLLWPQTFMNLSGSSVGKARDFYKLEDQDILIVCDDLNLPLAKLRFRGRGSSGGQKGLDDILRRLGSTDIARLRVGVGMTPQGWDAADFVLSKFRKDEGADIEQCIWTAADAAVEWVAQGTDYCMNRYNADPQDNSNGK